MIIDESIMSYVIASDCGSMQLCRSNVALCWNMHSSALHRVNHSSLPRRRPNEQLQVLIGQDMGLRQTLNVVLVHYRRRQRCCPTSVRALLRCALCDIIFLRVLGDHMVTHPGGEMQHAECVLAAKQHVRAARYLPPACTHTVIENINDSIRKVTHYPQWRFHFQARRLPHSLWHIEGGI